MDMNASPEEYGIIEELFTNLRGALFTITSPIDNSYNCIAWAAGDDNNWWWPEGKYSPKRAKIYWPSGVKADCSIEAFQECFETLGYSPSPTSEFEKGFEKVAFYVDGNDKVTHAARQLLDGLWTSKLGRVWDITHSLEGVCGNGPSEYGRVALILKRPT